MLTHTHTHTAKAESQYVHLHNLHIITSKGGWPLPQRETFQQQHITVPTTTSPVLRMAMQYESQQQGELITLDPVQIAPLLDTE